MMERTEPIRSPETSVALLDHRAGLSSNRVAHRIRDDAGEWSGLSWQRFRDESVRISVAMAKVGVERGTRVAICLPTVPIWEQVSLAVMRRGGVVVGLDQHLSVDGFRGIARQCGTTVLVTDVDGLTRLRSVSNDGVTVVVVGGAPAENGDTGRVVALSELLESATAEETSPTPASPLPLPSDTATIVFTSGSTGEPKGIAYRHEQLMAAARALTDAYPELGPEDRVVCWLPMAPLFQRMVNLVSMGCGMTTYWVTDPRTIFDRVVEIRPTFFIGVPRFYEKLEAALSSPDADRIRESLRDVKFMVSGSAPLPKRVLQSLRSAGMTVLEAYGLSENTVPVTVNRLSDFRFGSVGKPLAPNEVRLADDGEVLVRGPGVFAGYLGEATSADRFTEDGFYRTGDLGRFDRDGFLVLVGRKRELIKTSTGRRIGPVAIEQAYAASPSVDRVLVVGDGRKYLAAIVTLSPAARTAWNGLADEDEKMRLASGLLAELLAAGDSLTDEHRVQAFGVLTRPFGGDEVTVSQKLRRGVITTTYASLIDHLYSVPSPCLVVSRDDGAIVLTKAGRARGET